MGRRLTPTTAYIYTHTYASVENEYEVSNMEVERENTHGRMQTGIQKRKRKTENKWVKWKGSLNQ